MLVVNYKQPFEGTEEHGDCLHEPALGQAFCWSLHLPRAWTTCSAGALFAHRSNGVDRVARAQRALTWVRTFSAVPQCQAIGAAVPQRLRPARREGCSAPPAGPAADRGLRMRLQSNPSSCLLSAVRDEPQIVPEPEVLDRKT